MPEPFSICVYAGSSMGHRESYARAAEALGRTLARREIRTIYGGGRRGLMGVLADAVLDSGGDIVGIIPEALIASEVGHEGVLLEVVESMHDRKKAMADRADAFVALPGGIGTLEELVEVWTWTHLGLQDKPCALLDVDGYYRDLVSFLDRSAAEGFLSAESRDLLGVFEDVDAMIDHLVAAGPPDHQRLVRGDLV